MYVGVSAMRDAVMSGPVRLVALYCAS
jgi:hypothetical protein